MKKIFFSFIAVIVLFICSAPGLFAENQDKKTVSGKEFLELPLIRMQDDLDLVMTAIRGNQELLDFLKDKEEFVSFIKSQGGEWDEASEVKYTSCLIQISNNLVSLALQENVIRRSVDSIDERIRQVLMPEI